jgi:hypothetical protein
VQEERIVRVSSCSSFVRPSGASHAFPARVVVIGVGGTIPIYVIVVVVVVRALVVRIVVRVVFLARVVVIVIKGRLGVGALESTDP